MKTLFRSLLTLSFLVITSISFTACSEDACEDVSCQNGGVCDDGNCQCANWYEGTQCETKMRTKFIGQYEGTYTLEGQTYNTNATIDTVGNINELTLDGGLILTVNSSRQADILFQELIVNNDTFYWEGVANYNNGQLLITATLSIQDTSGPIVYDLAKVN